MIRLFMKLQDIRVYQCQDILKVRLVLEGNLKSFKSRQDLGDLTVSIYEFVKDRRVVIGQLGIEAILDFKSTYESFPYTCNIRPIGAYRNISRCESPRREMSGELPKQMQDKVFDCRAPQLSFHTSGAPQKEG